MRRDPTKRDQYPELTQRNWYRDVYLKSAHWKRVRTAALERAGFVCAVCPDRAVDGHHKTYERLGCEESGDVAALCRLHHEIYHQAEGKGNFKLKGKAKVKARKAKRRRKQKAIRRACLSPKSKLGPSSIAVNECMRAQNRPMSAEELVLVTGLTWGQVNGVIGAANLAGRMRKRGDEEAFAGRWELVVSQASSSWIHSG